MKIIVSAECNEGEKISFWKVEVDVKGSKDSG